MKKKKKKKKKNSKPFCNLNFFVYFLSGQNGCSPNFNLLGSEVEKNL